MIDFPTDILEKINKDFSINDDREWIINKFNNFNINEGKRIMRCLLFLAQGDIKIFNMYEKMARTDYRDVIMAAEYEYPSEIRRRDFNHPFPK